jgi:predicted transcriptional regulator
MNDTPTKTPMELTASVVAAYVANNPTPASEIPNLIAQVHAALTRVESGKVEVSLAPAKPAVPIKRSITADYIVCLEDGLKFKSLKRHLRSRYGMTPQQYRAKWGLPPDYPMVARNYAAKRSQLAKTMGLGQQARPRKGKAAPASK